MSLAAGTRLGPYEILASIGTGGMGEVYRARDTKLGREVAIKTLPDELGADKERVARFEREARLLASLNHPNIASIYGFEEGGRVRALVLELVEGPTLAERITRGPFPVDEAVAVADQIAKALVAGHEVGIIHRDLKPANIKLTEDGTVKVLDYGLAKALEGEAAGGGDSELSQSPTLTRRGTEMGIILGTAPYMSPEQAKGKRVDRRADVWAFGAVVYEMLTGHRAFPGEDVSETLASVLTREPVWEDLPPETPPALRQALRLCLTKDANERVRDIADVRLAISGAFATAADERVAPNLALRARALVAVAAAAGIAGALISAWALSWAGGTRTPPNGPTTRLSVMVPANRPVPDSICFPCRVLSISPDGTQLVYTGQNLDMPPGARGARWQLQLRSLTTLEVRDLPGTSGASQPFFSPDGKWVAFFTGTGELEKVSLSGGNPVTLVGGLNGSRWTSGVWTQDDTIVFDAESEGLASVSAEGGETTALTTLDASTGESYHRFPALVPGGRAVLFTVGYSDRRQIEAVRLESGGRRVVVENAHAPRVLASGHLLFQRGESILVAPFDVDDLMVTGQAVPIVDAVRFDNRARSPTPLAQLAASDNGTLVYLPDSDRLGTLGLVSRDGAFEPLGLPPGYAETPRVAPDGRAVAFVEARGSDSEVRIYDLTRGSTTKLGAEGRVRWLAWHPDNRSLTLGEHRIDGGIVSRKLDGLEEPLVLVPAPEDASLRDFSWSPDGTRLAYTVQNGSQYDIWVVTSGESPATTPFLESAAAEYSPAFSPDGRWLAYGSNESGREEVYIRRYPSGERFAVSTAGGSGPVWSPDGLEIYFQGFSDGAEKLFAVSVTATADGNGLRLGAAVPLFDLRAPGPTGAIQEYVSSSISGIAYDILPDGTRFLMVRQNAEQGTREIVLVQNWFEELKRLAPKSN